MISRWIRKNPPRFSIFKNYRFWIDIMQSITRYKHKDLFHVNELTMYSRISMSMTRYDTVRTEWIRYESEEDDDTVMSQRLRYWETTLLICGTYLTVIMGKDATINDGLFRERLTRLNCRMSSNGRRMFVHRNRISCFRDLKLSNIRLAFFPDDFSPLLRPLRRDVFHFIKMVCKRK